MSNEAAPKKKRRFFSALVPRTVAGKTAVITWFVLLLMLVAVWTMRRLGPESVSHSHAITWTRMMAEALLVLAIPVVLYVGILRWSQVIEGLYPDIDKAWQVGVDTLGAQGISGSDLPIFLILGSSDTDLEQGLAGALQSKLHVQGVPNEPGVSHALQWYASSEAIYLFCPGASALSALREKWVSPSLDAPRRTIPHPTWQARSATATQSQSQRDLGNLQVAVAGSGTPLEAPGTPATSPTTGPPPSPSETPSPPETSLSPPRERPIASEPFMGTIQLQSIPAKPTQNVAPAASNLFSGPPTSLPRQPAVEPLAGERTGEFSAFEGTVSFRQMASTTTPKLDQPVSGLGQAAKQSPLKTAGSVGDSPGRLVRPEKSVPLSTPLLTAGAPADSTAQRAPAVSKLGGTPGAAQRLAGTQFALPSSLDTSDHLPRLRYVCTLLKKSRRPHCGVNGIVTLIPFELSRAGALQLSALAQSARGDIHTVQETLGIRSPVTALLVGLEQDKGFTELVRRLPAELLSRRLGGRFDLRSRPTPEELNTHSDRLCDAFEDWVYQLFGREDALAQQRGNRKLYGLISRIRHELKPRLRIVLGQAFGCEPTDRDNSPGHDDAFFFSGCYFAASGANTGQPAFVKGVLQEKLIQEQSMVQWTNRAIQTHRYVRSLVIAGWGVAAVLSLLLLVAMLR